MSIQSFSGCHDFDPSCVKLQVEIEWAPILGDTGRLGDKIAEKVGRSIEIGMCPRCGEPLPDGDPIMPAGSRATPCRCIPICGPCGEDESYPHGLRRLDQWPTSKSARTRRRNAALKGAKPVEGILTDGKLITEDGVTELRGRPHPGGWLEFGHQGVPQ